MLWIVLWVVVAAFLMYVLYMTALLTAIIRHLSKPYGTEEPDPKSRTKDLRSPTLCHLLLNFLPREESNDHVGDLDQDYKKWFKERGRRYANAMALIRVCGIMFRRTPAALVLELLTRLIAK